MDARLPHLATPAAASPPYPAWLLRELRSDHAGEAGAVQIYRGILATSRDPEVREFAGRHLETECEHLALIDAAMGSSARSRLMPLWRLAGWLLGAVPGLCGARAVYTTIDAVESFVDGHYGAQIEALRTNDSYPQLLATLQRCRDDELEHRDEARSLAGNVLWFVKLWHTIITLGSHAGVAIARRF